VDVISYPLDGETLVQKSWVHGMVRNPWEAEDVDAVVEGHDDNVLGVGEKLAVVERGVGVAYVETFLSISREHEPQIVVRGCLTAAIDVHENWSTA
jgi:hypothetical protein